MLQLNFNWIGYLVKVNPLSLYLSQTLYMSVGCLKNGLTQLVKEDLEEGSVWSRGTGFISIIGNKKQKQFISFSLLVFLII